MLTPMLVWIFVLLAYLTVLGYLRRIERRLNDIHDALVSPAPEGDDPGEST